MAKGAKERLSISTLYLGSEELEQTVADNVIQAAYRLDADSTRLIVDGARCRRGLPESAEQMLVRMDSTSSESECSESTRQGMQRLSLGRVCLPHHSWQWLSLLGSLLRRPGSLPPAQLLESGGVQHSKVYAADDAMLLSGANLSDVYFRKRVDRWVMLRHAGLAAAAHAWVRALGAAAGERSASDLQGQLEAGEGKWAVPGATPVDALGLREAMRKEGLSGDVESAGAGPDCDSADVAGVARVALLAQCAPLALLQESAVWSEVVSKAGAGDRISLASGYFNPSRMQGTALLEAARRGAAVHILVPAPETSGFAGAGGIKAAVPTAYAVALEQFRRLAMEAGVLVEGGEVLRDAPGVHLWEWGRETCGSETAPADEGGQAQEFHAKGLWIEFSPVGRESSGEGRDSSAARVEIGKSNGFTSGVSSSPSSLKGAREGLYLSALVGSSNLGQRSEFRDMELSALVECAVPSGREKWTGAA